MIRIFNHYLHRRTLIQVLFDLGLIVAAVFAVAVSQSTGEHMMTFAASYGLSLAGGMFVINSASGLYQQSHKRSLTQSCARALFALLIGLPLAYGLFSLIPATVSHRELLTTTAMLAVGMVMIHRVYAAHAGTQNGGRTKILIFGSGAAALAVSESLRAADPHAQIVGFLPGPNEVDPLVPAQQLISAEESLTEAALRLGVDEIVVALSERRGGSMPLRQLLDCKLYGIRVVDLATYFEKTLAQIKISHVHAGWLIFGDGFNQGMLRSAVKRVFDLLSSLCLLVLSAPVMLVTAVLIKLESSGPMFYTQERVGMNGATFKVIKFRSMRQDAEKDGRPQWATKNDSRVTRVGNFIRKVRIDELPQLFNVLRGEMSMVGPRPERPFFVDELVANIPYYAVRHSVKPGVTGWAQVRYEYGSTIEDSLEKLQYDLYYVKNHTLFLDLLIMLETVAVVLTGRGAR
ncbi:sugar transferase, PEP-CTERM system associated/exopolysaccharide biosynthesis polyprenyl glycosylphosphotransferase [Roseateles sp. YR242]|uniref:TIGR03013 family XrtA/PEP-CTERM system glycosyltransferase n=1 Tax=Roseateles sp. YR242 TaxID=1855305 RepID=UPI0008B29ACB|nr:TIGR03013 family XrtA/PEP-CTERM system glycosyltransferase [Roseateles sp. YR242]SEL10270.1 sugar transferase, PEP-CTERM system associated/exopolysaccharide biosynthesis polyprenyl glycosylphosphotransferase [Roseateles sp. YR242]